MSRRRPVLATLVVALACLLGAGAMASSAGADGAPFVLQAGRSVADAFGYQPDYPVNVPAFDSHNVPAIRSRNASQDATSFVARLEGGVWVQHDFIAALRAAYPGFVGTVSGGGWGTDWITFDDQDRAYSALTIRLAGGGLRNVLLYSVDDCATWRVAELPFGGDIPSTDWRSGGNVAMEHFVGHNDLHGPPFIAVWRQVAAWSGTWSSRNQLYVLQPYWDGDQLVIPAPVFVTDQFPGLIQSAGGSSFAVTDGEVTHFIYAKLTPLNSKSTPIYAATYSQTTGTVGPSTFVASSSRANDVHHTPGICIDSQGYLHVITGAHNGAFRYSHSLTPHSTAAWTMPLPVCASGYRIKGSSAAGQARQTYLSFVCGPDDTLHIVFRQARCGVDTYFGGGSYFALSYEQLRPGGAWTQPVVLIVPPKRGYAIYYQKLAIDHLGRLFLTASYYADNDPVWTRGYRRYVNRMTIMSDDGGGTWRLATTADFAAGITAPAPGS